MQGLDAKMNVFIQRVLGLRPTLDETAGSFCRRRNRAVRAAAFKHDLQSSKHWALKVTTWIEHCHRHPTCPAAQLLTCQDPLWLQTIRALCGSFERYGTIDAGQTRTRASAGKPSRYLGPWYNLIDFGNAARDKMKSRATAKLLWTACCQGKSDGSMVRIMDP